MRNSRFKTEEIIEILEQGEEATPKKELCARHGISLQTFYRWRRKYGHSVASPTRRIEELEEENARLRQLLVQKELENSRLKDVRKR